MKKTKFVIGCILMAVFFKCSSACTKNMCMRWDTKMGNLLLICTVRNRTFNLQIIAPKPDLKATCTLVGVCSANVNLTVNKLSNVDETIMVLTLNASEVYNGRWTCKHGTNVDEASVEVAINQDKPTENPPITTISKEICFHLSLFTTNAGLLSSFVLISLILSVVHKFYKPIDHLKFTASDILVPCIIVSVLLSSSTIILSIIILKPTELIWKDCDRKYGHMVWLGVALAFVSIFVTILIRPKVCSRLNQQNNDNRGVPTTI